MDELNGRTAIVTGGGTGIGRGIALRLARLGINVLVCGRRSQPITDTLSVIRQQGGSGCAVVADVADERDVDRIVDMATEPFGIIDFGGLEPLCLSPFLSP